MILTDTSPKGPPCLVHCMHRRTRRGFPPPKPASVH